MRFFVGAIILVWFPLLFVSRPAESSPAPQAGHRPKPPTPSARTEFLATKKPTEETAQGVQKSTSIWPNLEVGKVGEFKENKDKYYQVRIVKLISTELMTVQIGDMPSFLVRGLPTKGLVDDKIIELKGDWKVTGTGPYQG